MYLSFNQLNTKLLNRTKRLRGNFVCLTNELGHRSSAALRLESIPSALLVLEPLESDKNYTTGSPAWVSSLLTADLRTSQPP